MAINSGTFSSKIWKTTHLTLGLGIGVTVLGAMLLSRTDLRAASAAIEPATMASIGSIEERFQAYNVEMLEVTGGRFLKPYRNLEAGSRKRENASTSAGMDPDLYEHRAPIDLTNSRLRKLAVLGPTYVRVSGTWANTTHFLQFRWVSAEDTAEGIQRCTYA